MLHVHWCSRNHHIATQPFSQRRPMEWCNSRGSAPATPGLTVHLLQISAVALWSSEAAKPVESTRSRVYTSNDQAWVAHKNGVLVRRFVGHRRLEGFSQGEPGGMYSAPYPLPVHHSFRAWAMNSGQLSIRRWVGAGY